MQGSRACRRPGQPLQPAAPSYASSGVASGQLRPRKGAPGRGLRVLFLLVFWAGLCKGAPMASNVLQEQDLQLWNEIDDVCSAYLARDAQPQSSNALEELCFMVLGLLQKTQGLDEKDNTKRFLFHYSKTHDTGNSDFLSSVVHPLLQLVSQLHERRSKRYKVDNNNHVPSFDHPKYHETVSRRKKEELRIPGGIQSRGFFIFRPRNGRRSTAFR